MQIAHDPTDDLLKSDNKPVDTSDDTILHDLTKLWHDEENDIEKLRDCLKPSSRYVLRKTSPIQKYYELGCNLGNPGTYGCVKAAKEIATGKQWAVKEINKWKFKDPELTRAFFTDLRNETRLMGKVNQHPCIIDIHEVFETIESLYIVMEACSGGELFERIQKDDGFSEKKASRIFSEMLSAIYFLHSKEIMHCDLKPENFIFVNKSDTSKIKMIDFGMAKVVKWRQYYHRMNGTPYYIAPEVLDGKYNMSCDMWSMGVILFILVFGFPPFFDSSNDTGASKQDQYKKIYKKIQAGFQPKVKTGYGAWFPKDIQVSNDYKDLIARLLRTNVASRMTAEEALAHPWITKQSNLNHQPLPVIRSLRVFRRGCALKNDILRILKDCKFLNKDQEAAVVQTFKSIDKDGDGVITANELLSVMRQYDQGVSEAEVNEMMIAVDFDGDHQISMEEFLSARIYRKVIQKEERLRKLFKCLDLDGNGTLNGEEIAAALESVQGRNLGKNETAKLIEDADANNDGTIDYEEFLAMFKESTMSGEAFGDAPEDESKEKTAE